MMASVFTALVSRYGAPANAVPADAAEMEALSGRLPPDLIAFWQAYGIGLWLNGKFQFCRPADYEPLIGKIFADLALAPSSCHLVGFSAFGQLLAWSERYGRVLVDLPRLTMRVPALGSPECSIPVPYPIATPLARLDREGSFDMFEQDEAAQPLFNRTCAKLGPLDLGQCYGFVPALALGGTARLDAIERLDAATHLSLLADAGQCRVMVRDEQ